MDDLLDLNHKLRNHPQKQQLQCFDFWRWFQCRFFGESFSKLNLINDDNTSMFRGFNGRSGWEMENESLNKTRRRNHNVQPMKRDGKVSPRELGAGAQEQLWPTPDAFFAFVACNRLSAMSLYLRERERERERYFLLLCEARVIGKYV